MPDRYGVDPLFKYRQQRVVQQARQQGEVIKRQVALQNQARQAQNERIADFLRASTQEPYEGHPLKWWKWWQKYIDENPEERSIALQSGNSESLKHLPSSALDHRTLVWTNTGKRPIAEVRIGDLVLGQDPTTGEVQYKAVLGRIALSTPSQRIDLGDQALLVSPGLPIWRAEKGWWLAADLQVGSKVHGLYGPQKVTGNSELIDVPAHHLAVADFKNFFVGEVPVLVHDVTQSNAPSMRIPGLPSVGD